MYMVTTKIEGQRKVDQSVDHKSHHDFKSVHCKGPGRGWGGGGARGGEVINKV